MQKNIKEIFLKNAFKIFILSLAWPIGFFIHNEILNEQIQNIDLYNIIAYLGPMITLPFIGYLLQERYEASEELILSNQKISELLYEVVQNKKLGIRYENAYLKKCWEVKNCNKTLCPAYLSENLRCWQIAGTYCMEKATGVFAEKIDNCKNCDVYKISTPNKPTEIGENFNNMMIMLEYMSSEQYKDFMDTIDALSKLIEIKDPYTGGRHSPAVQKYSLGMAKYLNLTKEQIENLKISSALHDIGKIGVKGSILNKNGSLDNIEYQEIKKHPLIGVEALKSIRRLSGVRKIIKYHHERYDGNMEGDHSSYIGEVKGDEIPIEARIITVADSYDAMTSDRPYRKAFAQEKAIKIIQEENGKQFDPKCVDAFLKFLNESILS